MKASFKGLRGQGPYVKDSLKDSLSRDPMLKNVEKPLALLCVHSKMVKSQWLY